MVHSSLSSQTERRSLHARRPPRTSRRRCRDRRRDTERRPGPHPRGSSDGAPRAVLSDVAHARRPTALGGHRLHDVRRTAVAATPSQLSAMSQVPAEARHSLVSLASAGQAAARPVAVSPRRRTLPPEATALGGHRLDDVRRTAVAATPSQLSADVADVRPRPGTRSSAWRRRGRQPPAPSQLVRGVAGTPAAPRHSVVTGSTTSAGQLLPLRRRSCRRCHRCRRRPGTRSSAWRRRGRRRPGPVAVSPRRRTLPPEATALGGHRLHDVRRTAVAATPSQLSAMSQVPAEARHSLVSFSVGGAGSRPRRRSYPRRRTLPPHHGTRSSPARRHVRRTAVAATPSQYLGDVAGAGGGPALARQLGVGGAGSRPPRRS